MVEMLTGYPPWHECDTFDALYNIVNGITKPNLPENCSDHANMFVVGCFKK